MTAIMSVCVMGRTLETSQGSRLNPLLAFSLQGFYGTKLSSQL
jgi:hypothetical protein